MQTHTLERCCPNCPLRRVPTEAGRVLAQLEFRRTEASYEAHLEALRAQIHTLNSS